MRKKSSNCMKPQNSLVFFIGLFLILCAHAKDGFIPLEDTLLKLPNNRVLMLVRKNNETHELLYVDTGEIIWRKTYQVGHGEYWIYAFFVPIKKGQYYADINNDGFLEIAIATWDGGNMMNNRYALIFTVEENSLQYLTRKKFNLEYGEYVYP